jgi:hypothetical protein
MFRLGSAESEKHVDDLCPHSWAVFRALRSFSAASDMTRFFELCVETFGGAGNLATAIAAKRAA